MVDEGRECKMKHMIGFLLALVMMLCTVACGQSNAKMLNSPETKSTDQSAVDVASSELSDSEAVEPSAPKQAKTLAKYAADILNADIYEIVPQQPYTEDDLTYYTDCRADKEQNDPTARPAISGSVENMAQYSTVLLGYPIRHGQAPKIIYTFLESYNFSGKTILPFCASHSSGIGSSTENLHFLANNADWLEGQRFAAGISREEIEG